MDVPSNDFVLRQNKIKYVFNNQDEGESSPPKKVPRQDQSMTHGQIGSSIEDTYHDFDRFQFGGVSENDIGQNNNRQHDNIDDDAKNDDTGEKSVSDSSLEDIQDVEFDNTAMGCDIIKYGGNNSPGIELSPLQNSIIGPEALPLAAFVNQQNDANLPTGTGSNDDFGLPLSPESFNLILDDITTTKDKDVIKWIVNRNNCTQSKLEKLTWEHYFGDPIRMGRIINFFLSECEQILIKMKNSGQIQQSQYDELINQLRRKNLAELQGILGGGLLYQCLASVGTTSSNQGDPASECNQPVGNSTALEVFQPNLASTYNRYEEYRNDLFYENPIEGPSSYLHKSLTQIQLDAPFQNSIEDPKSWSQEHLALDNDIPSPSRVASNVVNTMVPDMEHAAGIFLHMDKIGHYDAGKSYKFDDQTQRRSNSYELRIQNLQNTKQSGPVEILVGGIPRDLRLRVKLGLEAATAPPIKGNIVGPAADTKRLLQIDSGGLISDRSQNSLGQIDFTSNFTPLQISIMKPTVPTSFADDQYFLPHGFKGFALVINITKFTTGYSNRNGASHDTTYMNNLWSELGYQVTIHEGFFTLPDVKKILEDFKAKFNDFSVSHNLSSVIFIGSHGIFSKILTSDCQEIDLYEDVVYKFDTNNCSQLNGRPKIFLIQACQKFPTNASIGTLTNRTEVDEILPTKIDDAVVSLSTIPGELSGRDTYLGTWYGYCLAKVFMENARNMDLLRLLKKTQEEMRKINAPLNNDMEHGQLSTYVDFGIKTLYFNMSP